LFYGLDDIKSTIYIPCFMKIRIASLHNGTNYITEESSSGELGIEDESLKGQIKITGEIENQEKMLDVRLKVSLTGHFQCDKCAIEYEDIIDADLRCLVLFEDAESVEKAETEGLIYIGRNGIEADLTQEITDCLYCAMPIRKLCEPGCKGLCHKCGADLNNDNCECSLGAENQEM